MDLLGGTGEGTRLTHEKGYGTQKKTGLHIFQPRCLAKSIGVGAEQFCCNISSAAWNPKSSTIIHDRGQTWIN